MERFSIMLMLNYRGQTVDGCKTVRTNCIGWVFIVEESLSIRNPRTEENIHPCPVFRGLPCILSKIHASNKRLSDICCITAGELVKENQSGSRLKWNGCFDKVNPNACDMQDAEIGIERLYHHSLISTVLKMVRDLLPVL